MQEKFQKIESDEWSKLLNVFDQISELPYSEQNFALDNTDLTGEAIKVLSQMLKSQNRNSILDQSVDNLAAELIDKEVLQTSTMPSNLINKQFGHWKIISSLAQGGMGQVYIAERHDGHYEKQVALKLIKSGQYTELTKKRFKQEMQVLAGLEHANIARLIDGGSTNDDLSYIVMELVEGLSITEYSEKHKLNLNQRLSLLLQTCDAVNYAHQNLIIHGDIKPANVLVDKSGQIKLVDFGISRPIKARQDTNYINHYTPGYASPDQTQGKPMTTANDVYGLTALMLNLIGFDDLSLFTHQDEVQDFNVLKALIQSFKNNKEKSTSGLNSKSITQALQHELGAIIQKGLTPNKQLRYQNVAEFQAEIHAFLHQKAVDSYSQSKYYRWKKFVFHNKWPFTISTLGFIGMAAFAFFAIQQADIAKNQAQTAKWTSDFLLNIFAAADPIKNKLNPITVNELTQTASKDLLNQENTNQELMSESLSVLTQIQFNLGELDSAEALILKKIELLENQNDSVNDLASAHLKAGEIMEAQDKLDLAMEHFNRVIELVPIERTVNTTSISALQSLSSVLHRVNQLEQSNKLLDKALSFEKKIKKLPDGDRIMATLLGSKAKNLGDEMNFDDALQTIAKAKSFAEKTTGNPRLMIQLLGIESDTYYNSGDSNKSLEIDKILVDLNSQTFGADYPETIDSMARLAVSLSSSGAMQEAIELYLTIIEKAQIVQVSSHLLPSAYLNLGTAYRVLEQHQLAIENYKKANLLWPTLQPRMFIYESSTDVSMARSLLAIEHYSEAEEYYQLALTTIATEMGVDHPLYARYQIMYAPLLLDQNRLEQAQQIIPSAYEKLKLTYGKDSKRTALAGIQYAELQFKLNKYESAKTLLVDALSILDTEELKSRNHSDIIQAQSLLNNINQIMAMK